MTRSADIERMLDARISCWGRLDVLLNNAGIAEVRPLFDAHRGGVGPHDGDQPARCLLCVAGAAKRMREQTPMAAPSCAAS